MNQGEVVHQLKSGSKRERFTDVTSNAFAGSKGKKRPNSFPSS
jgi:hypothetical protein